MSLLDKTKVEENERVFPVSDKASTVQKTFTRILDNSATKYELNTPVKDIKKENNLFIIKTNDSKVYKSKFLILATGGNAYPRTGSTGDGYKFIKKFGHTLTKQMGGLAPIKINETWINNLQGIDIEVKLEIKANNKSVVKDRGSIIFTHNGISGPVILNNSMEIEKNFLSK